MKYDADLAQKICLEMGIEYHPEQEGVIIGGKKLPDNFSTAELYSNYDPCEKCGLNDSCDGWDTHFCCTRCMALGLEDCDNCDPWDI